MDICLSSSDLTSKTDTGLQFPGKLSPWELLKGALSNPTGGQTSTHRITVTQLCHTTIRQAKPAYRISQSGQLFIEADPFLLTSTLQQGQLLHEDFVMVDWLSIFPSTNAKVNRNTTSVNFTPKTDFQESTQILIFKSRQMALVS